MKQVICLLLVLLTLGLTACATPRTAETPATPLPARPTSEVMPPATATASPVAATDAPASPTATASPIPEPSSPLPAPLYFLAQPPDASDDPWQIWRLEADGLTQAPVTQEANGVQFFDVSPVDNALVYVSGLELIRTDAQGQNRTVLYTMEAGQPGIHQDVPAALVNPRWSPDGTRVAFGLNGINLIAAAGGSAPDVILPSTYEPNHYEGTRFYLPESWSPDGTRLLVTVGHYPEGSALALLEVATATLTDVAFEGGQPCCYPAWTPDGRALYLAAAAEYFSDPGLWRIDAATGTVETLVAGPEDVRALPTVVVTHVHPAPDGLLYAWRYHTAVPGSAQETLFPLSQQLARVEPSQAADPAAWQVVSPEPLSVTEVRWFPDARGVVVTATELDAPSQPPMHWIPTDGSPVIPLPAVGSDPRWGHP